MEWTQIVIAILVFVAVMLLAKFIDEYLMRLRQKKKDEKDKKE